MSENTLEKELASIVNMFFENDKTVKKPKSTQKRITYNRVFKRFDMLMCRLS